MMTLNDRLRTIAQLRKARDEGEAYLSRRLSDRDIDGTVADKLRSSIEMVTAQIAAWEGDVSEILERQALIAAEIARHGPPGECQSCGAKASRRSVGQVEDVIAFIADANPLEAFLPDLMAELHPLCGGCFGSKLRGLGAFVDSLHGDSAS